MKARILMVCVAAVCVVLAASTVNSAEQKTSAAATASAPATDVKTLTGTVETTRARKLPRLIVGETRYELVAAEKADAKVKAVIEGISKGEVTGTYTVKGAVTPSSPGKAASIKVVSIVKDEAK